MTRSINITGRKQGGAILITALVILIVLTILGLSGITSSSLEQRMASNNRQQQVAFEASEAALRAGETWLLTAGNVDNVAQLIANFNGTNGLYSLRRPDPGASVYPVGFNVEDPTAWSAGNSVAVAGLDPALPQPRYIVEYMGRTNITASGSNPNLTPLDPTSATPDLREYAFRVTAIAWGFDEDPTDGNLPSSKRVLQSTLRKRLN